MSRLVLFLLLVVAVPAGVYWASHGAEPPLRGVKRFLGETGAVVRPLRSRGESAETNPAAAKREPEAETVRPPEPEAAADPAATATPEATTPLVEPTPPTAEPPAEEPRARAERLFAEGRFADAATAYAGVDPRKQSLAKLGAALRRAIPTNAPDLPIVGIQTNTGDTYVGFAEESEGLLTIKSPTGRSESFPRSAIARRVDYPREAGLKKIAERAEDEAMAAGTPGARVFVMLETAFAVDRPDVAANILPLALALDEEKPYLLTAIRRRIAEAHQADLYVAVAACQPEPQPEPDPGNAVVVRTPRKLDGAAPRRGPQRSDVRSAEARKLMEQAGPLRREGADIYHRLAGMDLADIDLADIERGIAVLDKALDLYEKAIEVEDADEIAALLQSCSRQRFKMAFWKQQKQGR